MAKEVKILMIDIEFPDQMLDDETSSPALFANFGRELYKMVRDGCTEHGFDMREISPNSRLPVSGPETIFDLEEQT